MERKNHTQNRRKFIQYFSLFGISLLSPTILFADNATARINAVQLVRKNGKSYFSYNMDKKTKYKIFILKNPNRMVIDFDNAILAGKLKLGKRNSYPIKNIRYATRKNKGLRIVLDLVTHIAVKSKFIPIKDGQALQIEINSKPSKSVVAAKKTEKPKEIKKPRQVTKNTPTNHKKRFVIAIDAGHGGRDPGAVGKNKTYEKHVVLKIAKKLDKIIRKHKHMKSIMIRKGDYHIGLRDRMDRARANKADIFISIHADANDNTRYSGSSVYILSKTGASSEMAYHLATRENAYDKVSDVNLTGRTKLVSSILMDLTQTETINMSLDLAKAMHNKLRKINKPLRKRVESAGFAVLRSPDIPSVLVETAFLSNQKDELRLNNPKYQQKLAQAIFDGIKDYKYLKQSRKHLANMGR